jgi:hypothetical protein
MFLRANAGEGMRFVLALPCETGYLGFPRHGTGWPDKKNRMGSDAVSELAIFCLQTHKTVIIMRMGSDVMSIGVALTSVPRHIDCFFN